MTDTSSCNSILNLGKKPRKKALLTIRLTISIESAITMLMEN